MALPIEAAPDSAIALVDEMTDEEFYANISRVFSILLEFRGMEPPALADAMNIGRSTLYGKLQNGKFTAREVRVAARVLRVRVDAFYSPADRLLSESIIHWSTDDAGPRPVPDLEGIIEPELPFLPAPELASVP